MTGATPRAQDVIAKAMLERELQEHVRRLVVKALSGRMYHTRDSRGSAEGWPDCAIWTPERPAVLVLSELKRMDGTTTEDQRAWGQIIRGCKRVEYHLWRPDDWLNGRIEEVIRGQG